MQTVTDQFLAIVLACYTDRELAHVRRLSRSSLVGVPLVDRVRAWLP